MSNLPMSCWYRNTLNDRKKRGIKKIYRYFDPEICFLFHQAQDDVSRLKKMNRHQLQQKRFKNKLLKAFLSIIQNNKIIERVMYDKTYI